MISELDRSFSKMSERYIFTSRNSSDDFRGDELTLSKKCTEAVRLVISRVQRDLAGKSVFNLALP